MTTQKGTTKNLLFANSKKQKVECWLQGAEMGQGVQCLMGTESVSQDGRVLWMDGGDGSQQNNVNVFNTTILKNG